LGSALILEEGERDREREGGRERERGGRTEIWTDGQI
jgi:hypothetical protein